MTQTKNSLLKKLYVVVGTISLFLGLLGIILPLLPTTPFLLLTAYFYSKGSEKFYNKLINNDIVGSYIKNFREGKGISSKTKLFSILTIWLAILSSVYFFDFAIAVKIVLVVIGFTVSLYLWSLKTLLED